MRINRTTLSSGTFALLLLVQAAGCTENGTDGTGGIGSGLPVDATRDEVTPTVPILFVADKNGGLLSFKDPGSLKGDVPPATQIFGTFTLLEGGVAVGVDRFGDLMALSPDVGIAVFAGAESATGDLSPNRRITGPDTGLTHDFTLNSAMLYDREADRVFACNSSAVLIWDDFSSAARNGNVAPDRTITSPDLNASRGMALGPNGDLYVTATTHVAVFNNGAARDGQIAADRIIEILDETSIISGTTITVGAVCVDRANRLYVFDPDPGAIIYVLDGAASLDGVVAPDRTINIELPAAPNSLAPAFFPAALVIDSAGTGYVSDFGQDAIHIVSNIGERDGILPAGRMIAGPNTKFDEINGLFLWE